MRYFLAAALLAMSLLSACVVAQSPRGEVVMAPALPPTVVLQDDPYYYNNGYYYWYNNDAWYYSRYRDSRDWEPLPRDRYPREFRYQGRHWNRDRGWDRDDRGYAAPDVQITIAPPLPSIVILQDDPYYNSGGYYYWYNNDAWYYSRSRDSRDWKPLPRDRYPREFKFKGRHWDRDKGWDRDDRRDRDHDRGGGDHR